ncbi:sce7725 family protein [Chryseobacterium hagamense]|uniref:Sce7725 family protein n=1 Tax=Chryseobacterium hagamense TaxID=395935 RepID=A0A511YP02_9FLAO|nr:sce7725 family protein [Chryseobacterium hagamense]GEN76914.1 hypothetical protein CHA01nite_26540 [Chryseobacterium hagamense]
MYFPFINAKQYDLDALCEIEVKHYDSFIPVIIPANITSCKRNITKLISKDIYFILVLNYGKKGFPDINQITEHFIDDSLKNYKNFSIAYVIQKETEKFEIANYIQSFPTLKKSLIHGFEFGDRKLLKNLSNVEYNIFLTDFVNSSYIEQVSNSNSVLVNDGFLKQSRNVDYPPKNIFKTHLFDYHSKNAVGFGDFTIIGNNDTTGFAAFSVALHLTVLNNSSLFIYHFVSDDKDGQSEIARKYNDALTELDDFVNKNKVFITTGIIGFQESYKSGHYPGLGIPKKWSIKNHVEQICNYLSVL